MVSGSDRRITIGRVIGLFGVGGWIKVYSHTRPREAILNYSPWQMAIDGAWRQLDLAEGRLQGKGIIAQLKGYGDRDAAASLVGADIAINVSQLPAAGAQEYYWAELEGLRVVNQAGETLGQVSYLLETGANDVLVVQGERERLIPFAKGVVQRVDRQAGVIYVDWDAED
jgi:16S rRNA processing protein RimM